MPNPKVDSYVQHDTRVTVSYKDGTSLLISPDSRNGEIGEFRSAMLYREGSRVAMAAVYGEKECRFFTDAGITQQQLAEYWNAAVDEADKMKKSHDTGEIDMQTWMDYHRDFWDITTQGGFIRKLLQEGQLKPFGNSPSTNHR